MKNIHVFFVLSAFCLLLFSCLKKEEFIEVKNISLGSSPIEMQVGDTLRFTPVISPDNADNKELVWTSSDRKIAEVSNGLVRTVSTGDVTIIATAACGGATATCNISVVDKVKGIKLDKETLELYEYQMGRIIATLTTTDVHNKEILWSSADEKAVKVFDGNVVAGEAPMDGKAVAVTATSKEGGYSATCMVTVKCHVSAIKADKSSLRMVEGETERLSYNIIPERASDKSGAWRSSDSNVASVDSDGLVTAVRAGKALIIVSSQDENKADTCQVDVIRPVTGITIFKDGSKVSDTIYINKEEETALVARLTPEGATDQRIKWSSSDNNIVVISQEGVLTAKNGGLCTISATSEDGCHTASCNVQVSVPLKSISLDVTSMTLKEGESKQLEVTFNPADATDRTLSWSSEEESLVSVTEGKVYALRAPEPDNAGNISPVKVTVTSKDGGFIKECLVSITCDATDIKLSESSHTLYENEKFRLSATVIPSRASCRTVIWKSEDTNIANVSTDGEVTAMSEGSTVITARVENSEITESCRIEVKRNSVKPTGLTLEPQSCELYEGDCCTITPEFKPDDATPGTVTWSSSNETAVSVDQNGHIKVLKKSSTSETAVITAKCDNLSATCTVKLKAHVSDVKLNKNRMELDAGDSETLIVTVSPSVADNQKIQWSTDTETVATVDDKGKVVAVAKGTAVITAKSDDGGHIATCAVTVNDSTPPGPIPVPVTGITLKPESKTLTVGSTYLLQKTITPANASNTEVEWSSSNPSVVSVNENGKLTALAEGESTVTVTTKDGGFTAECKVTVEAKPVIDVTGVTLTPATKSIEIGQSFIITAKVSPDDAADKTLTWESDNTGICSVDQSGKVTGKAEGSAKITATSNNGKEGVCTVTVTRPKIRVTKVTVSPKDITAHPGEVIQLDYKVEPENADDKRVEWISGNASVVKVSNGLVTILGGSMYCDVTVRSIDSPSKYAICSIKIESVGVESVSLDKSAVTMKVGEKQTLTPMILPVNASKKSVKWSSSNTAIVSVSNGVIEAKSAGQAQITVTTDDKSRKAVCNVTVTDGPSGESDFDLGGVGFGNLN